jgi:hypothetical protein
MTKRKKSTIRRNSGKARQTKARRTLRQQEARLRGLAAINRVRRGESKSLSQAARAEGTTVKSIRELLPAALFRNRRDGRLRVKAGDPYSERVEIVTNQGRLVVTAHGSRERDLAGRHRATYFRVLGNKEPKSALKKFRNKTVGGHKLISDFERLSILAQAGLLGQLDTLYVSSDASV